MRGRPTVRVSLEPGQKEELERLARQKRRGRSVAFRAQIVLRCAGGTHDAEVARELRTTNATVGAWRKRFLARGGRGALR